MVKRRERNPLRADNVVCFDGSFAAALNAFRNAGEEPVLLVVDAVDREALSTIGQARSAGVTTEALVHVSDLGPLGRTVLTGLASALAQQTDAGTVLVVLREIERRTRSFVLVDSPAKLHRPTPNLWQHAWGLLPGTCFIGELSGRVTAVGRRGLPHAFADGLRSPQSTLHTTAPGSAKPHRHNVLDRLIDAVSPWRHITHPPAGTGAVAWWGPAQPVELCAFPADITSLVHEVHTRATACGWCGLAAVGATCAVCGAAVSAPSPTPPHVSPASQTVEGQLA